MRDALADVGFVLLVREGGGNLAHGMETVRVYVGAVHFLFDLRQAARHTVRQQFHQDHRVVEMVEHDDVPIQDVEDVGGIVAGLRLVLDGDVFEVAHGIEAHVAVQATQVAVFPLDVEAVEECVDGLIGGEVFRKGPADTVPVRITGYRDAMFDGYAADGVDSDEGSGVLSAVVITGFHQGGLGIEVTEAHVHRNRRVQVGQSFPDGGGVIKSRHIPLPFACFSDRFRHLCHHAR